jgi:hypothetical protein
VTLQTSAGRILFALAVLLPFEPRRPALDLLGFRVTVLEAAAALAGIAVAWLERRRVAAVLTRPPLPIALLAGYALVHVIASGLAPVEPATALKFAVRMVAMAAFAVVVCAAADEAGRRMLLGLAAAGIVVAALATFEGAGLRALDPVLAPFREAPFNVGGARRASASTEYPNLAAAFMVYGLVATAGLVHSRAVRFAAAALLSTGLLFTYSRGALVAAAAGLGCLALARVRWARAAAREPLEALAVLACGVAAFGLGAETFQLRLGSEGVASWYGAEYRPADAFLRLRPGQAVTTAVEVHNTGRRAWTRGGDFHLSYHWYDPERRWLVDGSRTALPRDLAPGERAVLRADVRAPAREGRYLLIWDMVQEHTSWFSGQGVAPAVVTAMVAADDAGQPISASVAAPVALAPPWRPGRAELWRLALGMWRERPLTGFGSDSFRRLYGGRAGRSTWDSRVYANNLFLEAAATTGILGVLCLVGGLVTAGSSARRAAVSERPTETAGTVFALVAAIAVHGLSDYLLAFTGQYLVLGLVFGAAGAARRAKG